MIAALGVTLSAKGSKPHYPFGTKVEVEPDLLAKLMFAELIAIGTSKEVVLDLIKQMQIQAMLQYLSEEIVEVFTNCDGSYSPNLIIGLDVRKDVAEEQILNGREYLCMLAHLEGYVIQILARKEVVEEAKAAEKVAEQET